MNYFHLIVNLKINNLNFIKMKQPLNKKVNFIYEEPTIKIPIMVIPIIANIFLLFAFCTYNAGKKNGYVLALKDRH